MERVLPSLRGWALSPVGRPAIHSAISAMMGFGHVPTGAIRCDGHTENRWDTALVGLASVRGRDLCCGRSIEASDFSVSQRVEDKGDQLAGDGHARLVLASA